MSEIDLTSKPKQDIYLISSKKEILNRRQEDSSCLNIIQSIADLIKNICEDNKTKQKNEKYKYFEIQTEPSISIKDYLIQLYKFSKPNISTIIITLIYIDRFCDYNNFTLTKFNIYKLILTSFIVASKYNEDIIYLMDFYSKIGGVPLQMLLKLELEFLFMIKFDLYVKEELYYQYYNSLNDLNEEEDDEEENV